MKRFGGSIIAGIVGSVLTLLLLMIINKSNTPIQIKHIQQSPKIDAGFTYDPKGGWVPLDFTKAAEKVMPAVVHIRSVKNTANVNQYRERNLFDDFFDSPFDRFFDNPYQRQPRALESSGSGVIINETGYIVTNNHVIDKADEITVTLHDKRIYPAVVIGIDPSTDIALIKIEEKALPHLSFSSSDEVKVGEWVLAVGNPFNLNSTVTAGIVSAKGRNINILKEQYAIESFIQTDAAINPGNSGGALVNLYGALIGINTAIASPTGAYSGYGFAVPSDMVEKIVEDLIQYGSVQRGYLGVSIRSIDGNLAEQMDLGINEGVYLMEVNKGSGADEAGLEKGDIITKVNGAKVRSASELQEQIAKLSPGDKANIQYYRRGKYLTANVVLKSINGEENVLQSNGNLSLLGAEFKALSSKEAARYGIKSGVMIQKLYPGILKSNTHIQEGFILLQVNGVPVAAVGDIQKALEGSNQVIFEGIYQGDKIPWTYKFKLN